MSQVKFYSRTLTNAEIEKISTKGQPLSEIATGSTLLHYEDTEFQATLQKLDSMEMRSTQVLFSATSLSHVKSHDVEDEMMWELSLCPVPVRVQLFVEGLAVAAAPLIMQQRTKHAACPSKNMNIFLDKQLELIQTTSSNSGGRGDVRPSLNTVQDVYACKGRDPQIGGEHYGVPATTLNISDTPENVFADFLYAVAENEVLVRGEHHDILLAPEFIDRGTVEAVRQSCAAFTSQRSEIPQSWT